MNFLEALNTKVADITKPPLLPVGTYLWGVHKPHRESTSKDGKWSTIEIPVVPKEPYSDAEDVNVDELSLYGDLKQGVNSIRFMLDNTAEGTVAIDKFMYNLKRFLLDTLKVEGDDDSTLKELLGKMVGSELLAQASHRQSDTGEVFCDVKNWAPVT